MLQRVQTTVFPFGTVSAVHNESSEEDEEHTHSGSENTPLHISDDFYLHESKYFDNFWRTAWIIRI